jgi:hypothetical protein
MPSRECKQPLLEYRIFCRKNDGLSPFRFPLEVDPESRSQHLRDKQGMGSGTRKGRQPLHYSECTVVYQPFGNTNVFT